MKTPVNKQYDCPDTGFTQKCGDGRKGKCPHWIHVQGAHPQSGETVDMWDCSHRWLPILVIDLIRRTNSQGAAVESLRNELVKREDMATQIMRLASINTNRHLQLEGGNHV